MKPDEFCLWLQGFVEICNPDSFNRKQVNQLREKLADVFKTKTVADWELELENHIRAEQAIRARIVKEHNDSLAPPAPTRIV
jgi:hypothetical protein